MNSTIKLTVQILHKLLRLSKSIDSQTTGSNDDTINVLYGLQNTIQTAWVQITSPPFTS